jgi:hypothetical protein
MPRTQVIPPLAHAAPYAIEKRLISLALVNMLCAPSLFPPLALAALVDGINICLDKVKKIGRIAYY